MVYAWAIESQLISRADVTFMALTMPRHFVLRLLLALMAILAAQSASAAALSVSFAPLTPATAVDLTGQGSLDWAHWGLTSTNSFDHRNLPAGQSQISGFTLVGTNLVQQTNGIAVNYSWTNGTPTVAATN